MFDIIGIFEQQCLNKAQYNIFLHSTIKEKRSLCIKMYKCSYSTGKNGGLLLTIFSQMTKFRSKNMRHTGDMISP